MLLSFLLLSTLHVVDATFAFLFYAQHWRRLGLRASSEHIVDGIPCVEIEIALPSVGSVCILEATAESQEVLVESALAEEEQDDKEKKQLCQGDPYGSVLWPAAISVAKHLLLDSDRLLKDQTVLELGAGTGLVSLAAALGGAKQVYATDYEPLPLRQLDYAALHLQSRDLSSCIQTSLFDVCNLQQPLPKDADVIVVADLMYEPKTGRALARRVVEALQAGQRIVVGDSPGRAGRPAFLEELGSLGIQESFVDTVGSTVNGARHDLICGANSLTVSKTPQTLTVAILELDPSLHQPFSSP